MSRDWPETACRVSVVAAVLTAQSLAFADELVTESFEPRTDIAPLFQWGPCTRSDCSRENYDQGGRRDEAFEEDQQCGISQRPADKFKGSKNMWWDDAEKIHWGQWESVNTKMHLKGDIVVFPDKEYLSKKRYRWVKGIELADGVYYQPQPRPFVMQYYAADQTNLRAPIDPRIGKPTPIYTVVPTTDYGESRSCDRFRGRTAVIHAQGICQDGQGDDLDWTDKTLLFALVNFLQSPNVWGSGGLMRHEPKPAWPITYFQFVSNDNGYWAGLKAAINATAAAKMAANMLLAYQNGIEDLIIVTHSNGVVTAHWGYMYFIDGLRLLAKQGMTTRQIRPHAPGMRIRMIHTQAANGMANESLIRIADRWTAMQQDLGSGARIGGRSWLDDDLLSYFNIQNVSFTFLFNRPDVLTYGGQDGGTTRLAFLPEAYGPVGRYWAWEFVRNVRLARADRAFGYGVRSNPNRIGSGLVRYWDPSAFWISGTATYKQIRAPGARGRLFGEHVYQPVSSSYEIKMTRTRVEMVVCRENDFPCGGMGWPLSHENRGEKHNQTDALEEWSNVVNASGLWVPETDDPDSAPHQSLWGDLPKERRQYHRN